MKKLILLFLLSVTSCTTYKIRVIHRHDGKNVYIPMHRNGLTWKEHWYSYFDKESAIMLIEAWRIQDTKQKETYIRIK